MADGTNPNLNLTPDEKRLYYQLFQAADKTNLGVVTGEVAVSFFERTNLPSDTLGLIWQIADKQNRGLLTPTGFGVVLRLIGHAQAGLTPTEELALQPGPLPKFNGLTPEPPPTTAAATVAAVNLPPSAAAPAPIRVPPLHPDDVLKFSALFDKSETKDGLISGDIAKQIFERARLPNEILGRIWNLADTKLRGALDAAEFVIAMHLITSYRAGAMKVLPQILPVGLYEAATRRPGPRAASVGAPRTVVDVPPVPPIPKQYTGSSQPRAGSPLNKGQLSAQSTGGDWLVTPQEKAHFDAVFATMDKGRTGFISGDQAVTFFTNAQLPEETLAQIWDLADIDCDGQLSKDEFAVAMYLVRKQRSTREPVPQALPAALIPPSLRKQTMPPPHLPQQTSRSASEDLFGLDVFGPPPQAAQSTGGSNPPFPLPPASPTARAQPTTFRPFVPSSTFGQSLTVQPTGLPSPTTQSPPVQPPPIQSTDDLLGDADPEESKKLTQETTDLANLSNQVSSLSKEMQNVQAKRGSAEQDLARTNQQKRDFETRLSQARAMYEQELKNFKSLEERLTAARADTGKIQQEFALLDGTRQDLQNQYNQASAALEADQRENASLKEKIAQVNVQISQLKPQLETIRSEARQQKGLAAINKKQLTTVEGERDRIWDEIDTTSRDVRGIDHEVSQSSPTTVAETAPVPITTSTPAAPQRNPFARRTTTGSADSAFASQTTPQPSLSDPQSLFDNVFGPSIPVASTSTPPPTTTFRTSPPVQAEASPMVSPQPLLGGEVKTSDTSGAPTPSASPPPTSNEMNEESRNPESLFGGEERELTSATESTFQSLPVPEEQAQGTQFHNIPSSSTSPPVESSEATALRKELSFDELFGGPAHSRSLSQKATDFEEAFAAMKSNSTSQSPGLPNAGTGGQGTEFPPIRELDADDSSTDGEGRIGFDDDFAPTSPPQKEAATPAIPPATEDDQQSSLTPTQQYQSPKTSPRRNVTEPISLGKAEQSSPFEDITGSVDPMTTPAATRRDSAQTLSSHATGSGVAAASAPKASGSDFADAFASLDLAPAKEAEDEDEDEDDFNSHHKGSSSFDVSFDSPSAPSNASARPDVKASNSGPSADFFDFGNESQESPFGGQPAQLKQPDLPPAADATPAPSSSQQHDWDALFSVLDDAKSNSNKATINNNTAPNVNGQSGAAERTASLPPLVPRQSSVAGVDGKPPGWALSEDSGDDFILQRLTSMGYTRDESLAALEKFDYNLDKAADFLTSKS